MVYSRLMPSKSIRDSVNDASNPNDKGILKRNLDIGYSLLLLTVPMFLFSATLLGLIFAHRVFPQGPIYDNLKNNVTNDEAGVVYVNLNSTLLIFVASWSSSLAPALIGFALTLSSYPIAQKMHQHAANQEIQSLPTPYQMSLLLQFLDGGSFAALWNWIKYRSSWRSQRQPQTSSLSVVAIVTICVTVLSVFVLLADTWLHIVTQTQDLIQYTPAANNIGYSMGLLPQCTNVSTPAANASLLSCAIEIGRGAAFTNIKQPLQVLNNVSDSVQVSMYNNAYSYLGVPLSKEVSNRDYTAKTFGIQTHCTPVTQECRMDDSVGAMTPFRCNEKFQGDVNKQALTAVFFSDEKMSSNATLAPVNNPFYFGMAVRANAIGKMSDDMFSTLRKDPEIVIPSHGGACFVLFCNSTVHDIIYDSTNGTISRFETMPSNVSVANIWQGSISHNTIGDAMSQDAIGYSPLAQAASIATFSNSAQEIADKVALAFSRIALAVGSTAVQPQPASAVQERQSILVARVPLAPLFTLVVSNMSFVALGIVLTFFAIASADEKTREIRARLSIAGLVANYFEGRRARSEVKDLDELFEEYDGAGSVRVAVDRAAEGGYEYQAFSQEYASVVQSQR